MRFKVLLDLPAGVYAEALGKCCGLVGRMGLAVQAPNGRQQRIIARLSMHDLKQGSFSLETSDNSETSEVLPGCSATELAQPCRIES